MDQAWRLLSRPKAASIPPRCRSIRGAPGTRRPARRWHNRLAAAPPAAPRLSHNRGLPGTHEPLLVTRRADGSGKTPARIQLDRHRNPAPAYFSLQLLLAPRLFGRPRGTAVAPLSR